MKKLISILLSVIMLVPVVSVATVSLSAEEIYFEISTADDLRAIDDNLSGNYKLMNDIDLSVVTASGGKYDFNSNGWEPIGSGKVYSSNAFTGVFDGNGYTIRGLRINVTSMPSGASSKNAYIGLFAKNSGTIRNLTVEGTVNSAYEYGVPYIGGITAYNSGNITRCLNKCSVNRSYNDISTNYAGGVAGYNKGSITECFNTASVNISNKKSSNACSVYSAGIACGTGEISDCYNTGSISSSHNYGAKMAFSGGINACEKTSANISKCYNTGSTEYAISNVKSSNCYFLIGQGTNTADGSKSLALDKMKDQDSFTAFDFESVWVIDSECGYSYPQLINNRQVAPIVVTSIEIENLPTKTMYVEGEELEPTGLVVNAVYSNGERKPVGEYTLSGFESTVGTHTVVVSYGEFTTEFDVTVEAKKPEYFIGDVNSDGEITIMDATAIQRRIAKLSVEVFNELAVDVDGNGEMTIMDATAIQRHIAKLSAPECIGKPVY